MEEFDPEIATQLVLWLLASAACITTASVIADAIHWLRGR